MATRKAKKVKRAKGFKSTLRLLREEKFPKLADFAKEVSKLSNQTEAAAQSMISKYETLQNNGQPNEKFLTVIKQLLGLSDEQMTSIKRSFGRAAGSKKAAKKKTRNRKNSKKAQSEPGQKQKPGTVKAAAVTPGTVTPEIAEQFAAAVKGANGMSLELAQKLLEEKVGS